jgi:hypothetical protein
MKIFLILTVFFTLQFANAQKVSNNLIGHYKEVGDSTLYSYFTFDNNGKVDIMGFGKEDYFIKGDSLIVFTNKSDIFKFILTKNKLKGVSKWVDKGNWEKYDSIVVDNRKDNELAGRRANLLNEYYEKTRLNGPQMELLFDGDKMKNYKATINDLCLKELPKACVELFGLKLGGLESYLKKDTKKMTEDPEMISLAKKIIDLGEVEGYTVLGSYYCAVGKIDEGKINLNKAVELGSTKASLTLLGMEYDEMEKEETKKSSKK